MKKTVLTIFIAFICIVLSKPVAAQLSSTESYKFMVVATNNADDDPDDPSKPLKGNRTPSVQYLCTVSTESGISISGTDTTEIYQYDISSEEQTLIASFTEASEFIAFMSSLNTGFYQICLHTSDNVYIGWLGL